MTTYITGVNAPNPETLISVVEDMVISHHKVKYFGKLRSPSEKSLTEWYTETCDVLTAGAGLTHEYKLYSGDGEQLNETKLEVVAPGHIRVRSSIQ